VDVTAYIRELLFGHDCVVVPGFGGFIGNYSPARIDKSTGTFYPPLKQISFNRNLNHNDGLLIGRISMSVKINYGDARNLVEEFVAGLRKKLEKGEKVVFDNIGSFVNNHEGNIQFEPDKNVNYYLDSYGLEPFQCLPLEGYDVRKRIIRHTEKDPVKQATNFFRGKIEATSMNPLVSAEFENNKKAVDEGNYLELPKTASAIKEKPVAEDIIPPKVVIPESSETNPYFVITGSFKLKDNAESQVNMLKEDGFTPEIVETGNGFYRVCALMCNDPNTAVTKKDSITKKFPGTWISRKK
jgi:hypothetical protein